MSFRGNSHTNVTENSPLLSEMRANQFHDAPVFIGSCQKTVFETASCGGEELAKPSMKSDRSLTKRHSGLPPLLYDPFMTPLLEAVPIWQETIRRRLARVPRPMERARSSVKA